MPVPSVDLGGAMHLGEEMLDKKAGLHITFNDIPGRSNASCGMQTDTLMIQGNTI
jgi:hypothetical protein